MYRKSIYSRIADIFVPVLFYLAVTTAASYLLQSEDISLGVLVGDGLCMPLLALWYSRDRNSEGRKTATGPAEWVICLAGGAALSALSSFLMNAMGVYGRFSNTAQETYAASPAVWLILGPGLAAPVCEELVYRGLLYRRLKKNIPTAAAALLSAAAFAIGHGNVIQFLYAFPMGLILCAAAERCGGNVILPVMIHLGANLFSVVMSLMH